MFTSVILSLLASTTFAIPTPQTDGEGDWQPAENSAVTCNKTSDKMISFYVGPQMETVLNDACAAMMPPCAYQERQPNGTVCAAVMDYPLNGPKSSAQHCNVVDAKSGNKMSGWDALFTVTPAPQPEDSPGVFWTRDDCYGYFQYIVKEQEPKGCHNSVASGIGSIKVGGTSSLKDTIFDIQIVPRK